MKTKLSILLLASAFLACQPMAQSSSGATAKVYVTAHGKKYHRAGCREIKHSTKITELTIKDAKVRGYTPCLVCKPPVE